MDERTRFQEACLLQACGRLPAEEAPWLARMLAAHPDWQQDLDAAHTLVQVSREVLAQRADEHPPLVRFEEVMALRPAAPPARQRAWLDALLRWWQQPGTLGLAVATFSALAIGLGLQTYRLDKAQHRPADMVDEGSPPTPATRSAAPAGQAWISVHFRADAPIGQVSALLGAHHLQVIGGPDADQTYLLQVPEAEAGTVLTALRAEDAVLSAHRVVVTP